MLDVSNACRPRRPGHRRGAPRDRCDHRTLLSHADRPRIEARIVDISPLGCSIHAPGSFHRGDRVRVLLPLLGDLHAQVAWSLDGCFGCWFDCAISKDRYPLLLAELKLSPATLSAA